MEKKKNDKSKNIHDILPLDLIHIILLRVPIRHLARLSKLRCLKFPRDALLYGFGYDALRDDYFIVVASEEDDGCQHLDCLSSCP
ncbi:uncharacterized protein DS421_17g597100 [Arachis hypogaea]|nr:uncharacterized protein DS421_17g597100 [Arachis hypogaea]